MGRINTLPSCNAGAIDAGRISPTLAQRFTTGILDLSEGPITVPIVTADSIDLIFMGFNYNWMEAQAATSSPSHIQFGLARAGGAVDVDGIYDLTLPIDSAAPAIHLPQSVRGSAMKSGAQYVGAKTLFHGYPLVRNGETLIMTVTDQTGAGTIIVTAFYLPEEDRGERIA